MTILTIVAPFYNEEQVAEHFVLSLYSCLESVLSEDFKLEIIAVDDGSNDGTYDVLSNLRGRYPSDIKLIKFSRNFGLEAALKAGLKKSSGDIVITMDTDMQDPPVVILKMIQEWKKGYDIVLAKRSSRSDTFFKKFTAKIFYKLLDFFSGRVKYEGDVANFRLHTRRAVDFLNSIQEVSAVFRVLSQYTGFKYSVVEYHRDLRYAGRTNFSIGKMMSFSAETIVSSSTKPLHLVGCFFVLALLLSLLLPIGLLFNSAWYKEIFPIFEFLSMCCGVILFCLMIIAEYLGQVLVEIRKRPEYLIESEEP